MLEIVTASKLSTLRDALHQRLEPKTSLTDFFAHEPQIMVQNAGMRQWIKLEITKKFGAFGRLSIAFPGSALFNLQRQVLNITDLKYGHAWPMIERIAGLLELLKEHPLMKELTEQWQDLSDPSLSERKKWYVAQLIAETFEEYELYRWNLIEAWKSEANDWQKLLMSHLYTASEAETSFRYQAIQKSLAMLDQNTAFLAPSYHYFALPSLVPYQLEFIKRIAQHRPSYLYVLSDELCANTDNTPKNWHFGSYLSEQKREFNALMYQKNQTNSSSDLHTTALVETHSTYRHELHLLQHAIQYNHPFKSASSIEDKNHIHFASTHNRLREVEVLHDWLNQLIYQSKAEEKIHPDDILIVSPDIQQYQAHLESVFTAENSPFPITFELQLPPSNTKQSLNEAINQSLQLLSSRCTTDEVLEWLSYEPLKTHLHLQDDELQLIRTWLQSSGIRWGLNAEHRKTFNLPPVHTHSWEFGLQRLALGHTTGALDQLYRHMDALDQLQQQDHIELLGKVTFIIRHIDENRLQVNQPKTMSAWLEWMNKYLQNVVGEIASQQITQKLLRSFGLQRSENAPKEEESAINYSIFKTIVQKELQTKSVGGARQNGRLLCSDMVPMRSIPFKVIALLGLNEGEFPRNEKRAPFSYLNRADAHLAGDRSRKLEDRALLKEYILSAQDHLFIGFQGKDAFTNEQRPPSPLLTQLIQQVKDLRTTAKISNAKNLVTEYPMQAHSQLMQAFRLDEQPQEEANKLKTTAISRLNIIPNSDFWPKLFELSAPEIEKQLKLDIHSAASRLSNPIQYFVKERLGIQLRQSELFDESNEPFKVTVLHSHQLLDQLIKKRMELHELSPENLMAKGYCGDFLLAQETANRLLQTHSRYESAWKKAVDAHHIDVNNKLHLKKQVALSPSITLDIDIEEIDGWFLSQSASSDKYKYRLPKLLLNLWLGHYFPNEHKGIVHIVKEDEPKNLVIIEKHDGEYAEKVAKKLNELLVLSYTQPLNFHPEAASHCIKPNRGKKPFVDINAEKMLDELQKDPYLDELGQLILDANTLERWAEEKSPNSFTDLVHLFFKLEYPNA